MVREIAITLYLSIFKLVFNIFNLFPVKNKITFIITFGDNSKYVYDEIRKQGLSVEVVVLYKGASNLYFKGYNNIQLIPFETMNIIQMLRSIYHLATSKYVLVDNYFGVLAVANFKKGVECIQLWHASGAIKKFGLEDRSIEKRSSRAQERFKQVYRKFHKVIVGSDIMADTFKNSFNLTDKHMLKTGIPRTDFYYNEQLQRKIIAKFTKENPLIEDKKRILYAPTYRDNQLDHFELELDLDKMFNELGDHYTLLLRLHPAIKNTINYSTLYPGFVYDFSTPEHDINELLLIADYLVTDYSSLPFEYSLLNKPMIFFAYDLESYKKDRGILDNYEHMLPGPVVTKTDDVIEIIKGELYDLEKIEKYSKEWNKYSTGLSSQRLIEYMFEEDTIRENSKVRLGG